ncbi:MAG: cupin [Deltaproteobacteria bacterium]|nr:MAG: cupin [Deltaproteobacteria bacterium]TMQ10390.1 MAG: cupin [Deltaproteobacteria bacterium]
MTDEVLFCPDLDRAIALFSRLGLRLDTIFPADDPTVAALSGHGARVRLVRAGATDLADPDGIPAVQPSFTIARAGDSAWRTGRAGMQYRDLLPDRQGGRYIASHIRIPEGGPVPDYVHFHVVQFQIIYCYRGWVRVVYDGQGEPFVMQVGDCVLQPPRIRHRVLEASPGLEVLELGMPAIHATHVDHDLALPSPTLDRDRDFDGQRFVRFLAASAQFAPAPLPGFDACELGIAAATRGLAGVSVLRARDPARIALRHDAELWFHVVLRGELTLDDQHRLGAADAFTIPAGRPVTWSHASPDLELLQVTLPARPSLDRIAG